ncbi:hypothetical protein [Falsiroseomonas sp.]|uniref:hypothetical protein n=1 Tax=Falsiroseomonas sp. TaxID=2870721 RepID=UPI003F708F97
MVPHALASPGPVAARPDPSLSRAIAIELRRLGQRSDAAPDALHELLAILFLDRQDLPAAEVGRRLAAALMLGDAEAAWAAARCGRRCAAP